MQRANLYRGNAAILALLLCTALAPATGQAGPRQGNFVDVSAYLQDDAAVDAWYTMRYQLRQNFDDICGDTFCEGEYTNIEALRFVCSVHRSSGRLGSCGWSFAASDESVEPVRGRISVDTPAWLCLSPLSPGTTIEALLAALQGDEPLYAALPGGTVTLFDGLVDCL